MKHQLRISLQNHPWTLLKITLMIKMEMQMDFSFKELQTVCSFKRWTSSEDVLSWLSAHLYSQRLDVVGAVRSPCEVRQVELDLVPAVVQPHGHGADEGLHPCGALVVTGSESPPHVFIIQYLMQDKGAALRYNTVLEEERSDIQVTP